MQVAVVGAGAVGGLLASRLARAGHEVAVLARGANLAAIRRHGLRVEEGGQRAVADVHASDDPAALGGAPELLVVALKGGALARDAARLTPLIGPETVVLPAMNGVPWWFLDPAGSAGLPPLTSVDPQERIARALPLAQTLGCVVHLSSTLAEPGVVRHDAGWRLVVGEPRGGHSERAARVAETLEGAGFEVDRSADVRRDIWYKLWGNMTVNPVSALTGGTGRQILDDDLVVAFMVRAMAEAAEVGRRVGCPIDQTGEQRLGLARELGDFRTSMLQDAEAGREIELEPLTGAVREIASRVGVATPWTDALHGLTRLMGTTRGLWASSHEA